MSTESVMTSNHLILCHPLLLLPSIFPASGSFAMSRLFTSGGQRIGLQYFGHLMQGTDSFEKTLMLGKFQGGRRRVEQRTRWFDGMTDSMDMNLSKFQELVMDSEACCAVVHGVTKSRTRLIDWIELSLLQSSTFGRQAKAATVPYLEYW